jgi:undecaprenyl-diphosphatase
MLCGWSSFPSDHAILFFSISTGLFFISKKIGLFAILYSTLAIMFPRIYLGLHYPTDILAGAVIGVVIASIGNRCFPESQVVRSIMAWSRAKPEFFYPSFFLLSYQVADMFDSSRALLNGVSELICSIAM